MMIPYQPDMTDLLKYLREVKDILRNTCNAVEQSFQYPLLLYCSTDQRSLHFAIAIDPTQKICILTVSDWGPIHYCFWCESIAEVTMFQEQLTCYERLSHELRSEFNSLIKQILQHLEAKTAGHIIPALFYFNSFDIFHINQNHSLWLSAKSRSLMT